MSGSTLAELAALVERQAGGDGRHPTAIGALSLSRYSKPTEPVMAVCGPSLCLVAGGRKRVILGDEMYTYDPARFLLASVALPVAGQVVEASPAAPYLALRIGLDPGHVAELIAEAGPVEPADPAPARGLAISPVEPPLLDAVVRLVRLLDAPREIGVLGPLVLREITYRLLLGEQGPRLRQIAAVDGGPAGSPGRSAGSRTTSPSRSGSKAWPARSG